MLLAPGHRMPYPPHGHHEWPESSPWTGFHLVALAGIVAITIVLGWGLRHPDVLAGGDDITYFLLAKSLVAGHYRDLFLFGTPLHAQYPPGTPLWLAAIGVTGLTLPAVQLGHLLMLATTAVLVADAMRRLREPWLGVLAAACIGCNPTLLQLAGTMLSETLFTLLATVATWALLREDQADDARHRNRAIAVAVVAAAAAFLTRSAGLAIVAMVPAVMALRRQWRAAGIAALIGTVVVACWFVYVSHANAQLIGGSYIKDLSVMPLESAPDGLIGRLLTNLRFYLVVALPRLFGLPPVPETIADNLVWIVMLGSAALAGAFSSFRRWPAASIVMAFSGAILLAWPWSVERLAAPLIPIAIAMMLLGAWWLAPREWRGIGRYLPLAGVAAILGLGIVHDNLRRAKAVAQCPRDETWQQVSPCTPPHALALVAAAKAAATALPAGSVIATSKEAVVYYFSGHQAVRVEDFDRDLDGIREAMVEAHATHLLLTRMTPSEERLGRRLAQWCGVLTEAVPLAGPAALLAPRRAEDPDACAAVKRVLEWQNPDP